ncbi:MAG: 4Fe-4S binding protein [Thermodesulfobacteriota bacterium]
MTANEIMRDIIEIDETKCTGCGQCVTACAEGALAIVDGKAKLVSDIYCDGLGACLGGCPEGALKVVARPAPAFDEHAVEKHLAAKKAAEQKPAGPTLACGCPGSAQMTLAPKAPRAAAGQAPDSALSHWPIKLALVQPAAPFLRDADLLLLADCTAAAHPDLHRRLLSGRAVVMGCPKFDNPAAYTDKLAQVLAVGRPRSLTVAVMEVPCCKGFVHAAKQAREKAAADLPVTVVEIARDGSELSRTEI